MLTYSTAELENEYISSQYLVLAYFASLILTPMLVLSFIYNKNQRESILEVAFSRK